MIAEAEAKMKAASLALEAVTAIQQSAWRLPEDQCVLVAYELYLIRRRLMRDACGGDKILIRQLEKETGRQVRPPQRDQKAMERIAKARGKQK